MRNLYLIRHAETANRLVNQTDAERSLTANGTTEAQLLGQYLSQHKIEKILFSGAVRTAQTTLAINEALQLPPERLVRCDAMYYADVATLLDIIQSIDDCCTHVALVAHNPGISALASVVCSVKVPTFSPAQVVALVFEVGAWQQIAPHAGQLRFVYRPAKE